MGQHTPERFSATVVAPEGCTMHTAQVQGSSQVLLAGDCGDAALQRQQPAPALVLAALPATPTQAASSPGSRTVPAQAESNTWGTCAKCRSCLPTLPPRDGVESRPAEVGPLEGECGECGGCTVQLAALGLKTDFKWSDTPVKVFLGASGAGVMKGNTTEGAVIVKFWCGLVGEWRQAVEHKPVPLECKDEVDPTMECPKKGGLHGHRRCNHRFLDSLNKLTEEAGLAAITPTAWSGPVKSFLPPGNHDNTGMRMDARAMFYRVASGVSIEAVTGGLITNQNLLMLRSIKSEQVRLAATFDLMFSEQDRHGQNVFIDAEYNIVMIDNEGAFGPINSMFIPGTQKYEIYRVGYAAVCCGNLPPGNCPGRATPSSPESLLDYRCHAPGGKIGMDYPKGTMDFLRKLQPMTAEAIFSQYGMSRMDHARVLKERVGWMLEVGFEGTLAKVLAGQEAGDGVRYGHNFSYKIHPPCCDIARCNLRKHAQLKL